MRTIIKTKQNQTINKVHRIKAHVLTPVSIGDGGQISPLADYYYDANTHSAYFLNKSKFEQLLLNTTHLEAYIKEVNEVVNERKNEALLDFLKRATGKTEQEILQNYFHHNTIPTLGLRNAVETATIVKNIDQPYIPGSTLKGVIRTAILHNWLTNDSHRHKILNKYLQALEQWEKLSTRRDGQAKKEIYNLQKNILNEDDLFGKLKYGQDSRKIKISDSQTIEKGIAIVQCDRIPLRISKEGGKTPILPILREAIWTDVPLSFTVAIEYGINHPALKYLETIDTKALLKMIGVFAKDIVIFEKYLLKSVLDKDNVHPQIEKLYNFYDELHKRMEDGETFIRVGFGKTQYDNSLALAPYNGFDDDDKSYDSFGLWRLLLWKLKEDQLDYYPKTRLLTARSEPLGWVRLS